MAKGEALTGDQARALPLVPALGEQYDVHGMSWWYGLQLKLARKLIFSKWQEAIGRGSDAAWPAAAAPCKCAWHASSTRRAFP
jgi:long-chain acyl-CoA synthetase